MIFGIGVDLVEVARMQDGLKKFPERFARKILSDSELHTFQTFADDEAKSARFLAKAFAVKEACVKALGTGFSDGIQYADVSYAKAENGKPHMEFSDSFTERLKKQHIRAHHLSVTDEQNTVCAMVVLET